MTVDLGKAALDLLLAGFSVFPLEPRAKTPCWELLPQKTDDQGRPIWLDDRDNEVLENTGRPKHTWLPFADERATVAQVRAWWTARPDANIAIATGRVSGCFLLDIDGPAGVDAVRKQGKMPPGVVGRSGKDQGWHLYFEYPLFPVGNHTNLLPSLDIRGDHGYVVAPPSVHPNGKPYTWKVDPLYHMLTKAPTWLLDLLHAKVHPARPRRYTDEPANPEEDYLLAKRALAALNPDRREDYEKWIQIGASLKPLGDPGLGLWEAWSAGSSKFRARDCSRRWGGFRGTSLGVLFWCADEDTGKAWRPLPSPRRTTNPVSPTTPPAPDRVQEILDAPWQVLPLAVRGALNAYAPAAVGPVVELWHEGMAAGLIRRGDPVSVKCLEYVSKTLQRRVTRRVIESALNQDAVQFCTVLPHYIDSSIQNDQGENRVATNPTLDRESERKERSVDDPCNPRAAGRPATLYTLVSQAALIDQLAQRAVLPIIEKVFPANGTLVAPIRAEFLAALGRPDADTLADHLEARYRPLLEQQPGYVQALQRVRREYRQVVHGLEHPQFAPIPPGRPYGKAGQYVTECARVILAERGGVTQYSKCELERLIGCSERSLLGILRRLGAWVLKDQTQDGDPITLAGLEAALKKPFWDKRYRGVPRAVKSSRCDHAISLDRRNLLLWAKAELASGATLHLRYHQANRQFLPCWTLRALWIQAVWAALFPAVEAPPAPVKQQALFDEPVASPVVNTVPPTIAPPVVNHPTLTYPERWLQRVVQMGTGSELNFRVLKEALPTPTLVQYSLDLLLDLPLADEAPTAAGVPPVESPCPDAPAQAALSLDAFRLAWGRLQGELAFLRGLLNAPAPLALLPARCGAPP